uniref:RING-type domain-containing protein n=1 Tax=Meloidogyne enterolobii TaxID=390850 RepID=A0A6V7VID1_MELEN|nr:unnamed protein product [Meloidogyne enterolobii]
MVYFRFGKCIICCYRLRPDNVYTLKNCNHTYHHECVAKWISEGSKTCPTCRVPAILTDIKQLFVEKAGDSSGDSSDELTQSSSYMTTKNLTKILKTMNSKYEKEIQELKQNFQKLKDENDICLKQKDEKIMFLEEEIKKANNLFGETIGDLIKLNNLNCMNFVEIKNKWNEIDRYTKCCDNNCINTNKPVGNCIKGNGFVNLIDDENIKYLVMINILLLMQKIYSKKPQNCFNYSLYYFEIKCKFEKELNGSKPYMEIGLTNCSTNNCISYVAKDGKIWNEKGGEFQLSTFSWNNNDIFGCGLVYPPTNISNEFPYVFFTQNGNQIGKGVLLKDNFDSYEPYIYLNCCSVEANFGNDLEYKPFKYDISKLLILKEFFD